MNDLIARVGEGALRARDFARGEKYVRPVLHVAFYDPTWPRDKSVGKHILANGGFFPTTGRPRGISPRVSFYDERERNGMRRRTFVAERDG